MLSDRRPIIRTVTPTACSEVELKIGILSDTHDQVARTKVAIHQLHESGADAIIHCGDLTNADIVEVCSVLPFYFVFGNHDADMTHILSDAAERFGANCLNWGGEIELADKRIAIAHGHFPQDFRPLLARNPDYFLFGHSHQTHDSLDGGLRRINPGALHRTAEYTTALLDLRSDALEFVTIKRGPGRSGVTM